MQGPISQDIITLQYDQCHAARSSAVDLYPSRSLHAHTATLETYAKYGLYMSLHANIQRRSFQHCNKPGSDYNQMFSIYASRLVYTARALHATRNGIFYILKHGSVVCARPRKSGTGPGWIGEKAANHFKMLRAPVLQDWERGCDSRAP